MIFLGPSGCGKTTTLRVIARSRRRYGRRNHPGLTKSLVSSAQPHVDGVPVLRALPHLTVKDNVGFGHELPEAPAAEREAADR